MDPIQQTVLDECAERLGEHFDGALILVCHKDEGQRGEMKMTTCLRGNDYAAVGMAHTFLEMQQAIKTGYEVKQAMDND